ncbi:MAG TPA: KTSC domain-containing protein [Rhizorhapis sp.]
MPSTVIRSFEYDPAHHRLEIEFVSGRRYSYRDVPPNIATGMQGARSKGSFFNRRIRDHYDYTRLS